MEPYFRTLFHQISTVGCGFYGEREVDNVYVGGGTPSVAAPYLEELFETIMQSFRLKSDAEISVECNPESVTPQLIETLYNVGVNRVSLGVQSLSDELLHRIGRAHNRAQALEALSRLTPVFPSVGVDVMVGLPGQDEYDLLTTLDELLAFRLDHVSCYSLILEEGTALLREAKEGRFSIDEDFSVDLYDLARGRLAEAGFDRYEISNFCKNGAICRYNTSVWQYGDYLGLGLGASSFIKKREYPFLRIKNTEDFSKYLTYKENQPTSKSEEISLFDAQKEFVMLGLRLEEGLSLIRFVELFGETFDEAFPGKYEKLSRYLSRTDTHLRINSDCFYISNSIISEIIF